MSIEWGVYSHQLARQSDMRAMKQEMRAGEDERIERIQRERLKSKLEAGVPTLEERVVAAQIFKKAELVAAIAEAEKELSAAETVVAEALAEMQAAFDNVVKEQREARNRYGIIPVLSSSPEVYCEEENYRYQQAQMQALQADWNLESARKALEEFRIQSREENVAVSVAAAASFTG